MHANEELRLLGWNPYFQQQLEQGPEGTPARVGAEHRGRWTRLVLDAPAEWLEVCGALRRAPAEAWPAVGDWVVVDAQHRIRRVLARRTHLVRQAAGPATAAQVSAANVDVVFVVTSANQDLSPRRIERYLTAIHGGGARPVIVLNKADLVLRVDPAAYAVRLAEVEEVAGGAPVHAVSALAGDGLDALAPWLAPGQTVALLGSSGVGKSTLANALAGADVQATGPTREADSRGRHTTTHRELVALPRGAWLIDTPGMRELGLTGDPAAEDALGAASFGDIVALAARCKFGDCAHAGEPGCAIARALRDGTLDAERHASWQKLGREMRAYAARHDKKIAAEEKARWKAIHVAARNRPAKGRW